MSKALEYIAEARDFFKENPDKWMKGDYEERGRYCAYGYIRRHWGDGKEAERGVLDAYDICKKSVKKHGIDTGSIFTFNDSIAQHANDVVALFDDILKEHNYVEKAGTQTE